MNGNLCLRDRLASRVVNWWHKWETPHSHGAVSGLAGRRAGWQEFLRLFELHVAYLLGKYNTVADT